MTEKIYRVIGRRTGQRKTLHRSTSSIQMMRVAQLGRELRARGSSFAKEIIRAKKRYGTLQNKQYKPTGKNDSESKKED